MTRKNEIDSLMRTPDARSVAGEMVEAGLLCKCGCRAARHAARRDEIGHGVALQSRPCLDCACKSFETR